MSDYGSVEGVAALVTTWTRGGEFFDADIVYDIEATNPSLTTVEDWLDTVSQLVNTALAQAYFETPVEDIYSPAIFGTLSLLVNANVADLVAARNNSGRFFSEAFQKTGVGYFAQIQADIQTWVDGHLDALQNGDIERIQRLFIVEDE